MSRSDQAELFTRTGPSAPMGRLMRRYWIPGLLSEELPDPDGAPMQIRILGEDLVAFRSTDGTVGVLDLYCPHRRASLVFGRNEDGGLRCIYHGWKLDVDGRVVEMPCEPPTSRFKEHIRQKAYPTLEVAGVIWVYMGPPESQPPLPTFRWLVHPDDGSWATKFVEHCNWAQAIEGNLDTFHTNILHSGYDILKLPNKQIDELWRRPSRDSFGHLAFEPTSYGSHYAAIRRATEDPANLDYIRVYEFVFPFYASLSSDIGRVYAMTAYVPIDDEHTMVFGMGCREEEVKQRRFIFGAPEDEANEPARGTHERDQRPTRASSGVPKEWTGQFMSDAIDEHYRPLKASEENYGQERDTMVKKDSYYSFSGFPSIGLQDLVVQESMSPIVDRSQEHLASSDFAIIQWRTNICHVVNSFLDGSEPPGISPPAPYYDIASSMAIVPRGTDWREVAWQANTRAQ